ncbi:class F sortase [Herbidospora mongoliensis]|uniref:class F sortase n=1 Tax=Herbidospora mongoliensis TaxID=688067 RepID=UPI000A000A27|nr:class F sortase [Herbidospora mongoliensis]
MTRGVPGPAAVTVRGVLGLAAVTLTVAGALLACGAFPSGETPPAPPPAEAVAVPSPAEPAQVGMPRSRPVRLDVESIGVHVDLTMLTLNPDGTVQVPPVPEEAGWYEPGYAPGEPGSAVILGHVDGEGQHGVFYDLGRMRRGETVDVTRADGRRARFTVTSVERVPKDRFPAQEVYGPSKHPQLRLVTCGGTFDERTGHYRDNVIVTARLVTPGGPATPPAGRPSHGPSRPGTAAPPA